MNATYLGEVVRQQRKMLGLSQELVCEGLCAVMTLSRFESGKQTPSRDCVTAILQRLGLPDDRYYAHLTQAEARLVRLRKETLAYCGQFEQALGENRQQARMNAMEKLQELEHCIKADDQINQQFILGTRVILDVYPPPKQLQVLVDAIRLTSPKFDLDKLENCLYCTDEIAIINQIAVRYARCGERKKAIDIYRQLLDLMQKRTANHDYLNLITFNYALQLGLEKRLNEALKISKLGQQACIQQGNYSLLPRFLHIDAECYYLMGENNKVVELCRSAYYIYGAILDSRNQELLKTDVSEQFHLML